MPASLPHLFQALFKDFSFFFCRGLALAASEPGGVHAALMLREEVLAVEVVCTSGFAGGGIGVGAWRV